MREIPFARDPSAWWALARRGGAKAMRTAAATPAYVASRDARSSAVIALLALGGGILLYMLNLREMHFPELLQLGAGWSCLAALFVLVLVRKSRQDPWRLVFILVSAYLALRYLWWRSFETLIYTNAIDFLGMALLFLAELYSLTLHLLSLFVNMSPLVRGPAPLPADRSLWPTVDVFIPTYSEDPEIVRLTALAATQIDYPREKVRVYILDDGGTLAKRNDPARGAEAWARRLRLKEIARGLGVEYLTRETNRSAKAGNLNHGLAHSDGELILFLDCDHVPTADILQETTGHFLADAGLFLVQTPHFFANAAPAERSFGGGAPVPDESEMFYRVIHPGMDNWNASYFCGSAAIMRRRMLEEIGGLRGESITEDAETAFELHRRGYRSAYVNRPMVCGLAPEAYSDYVVQHTRWAQGMTQIFILHNPLFCAGLTIAQRICYVNICLFWFFGIVRVIYFLAPAGFLIFGLSIYHASAPQVVAYALPYVLSTFLVSDFLFGRTRRMFFSEIYESVQSVFLAPAVLGVLRNPRRPAFKVTPKGAGMETEQLNALSFFFFAILSLNLAAAVSGLTRIWLQPEFRETVYVTLGWCLYNTYLCIVTLGALWERRQARRHHRLVVSGQAMVQFPRVRERVAVDLIDLSLSGMGFVSKFGFEVKDRERVVVEAASADGLVSYFEAEVRRIQRRGGRTLCGANFLTPAQTLPDVVHYVYGDSARWLAVWDARERGISLAASFWSLTRMGVRGAWICLTFVLAYTWKRMREFVEARLGRAAEART
ncbi:MAG TPA: UDP-forming cellulose synthase catalytic subunit [Usitatibacteraceae bacterium]|nr:UDP-forming cellulose synthase catalytic subunit [Usitatibacteraceae bacterium]